MAIKSKAITDFIRGDSRTINIQVYQPDGVTPFDLTGCKVYFTVNATSNNTTTSDATAAIALSTTTFTNSTPGQATLVIPSTTSQTINPGTYYYDVQVKDTAGNVSSLGENKFIVNADVTRSTS